MSNEKRQGERMRIGEKKLSDVGIVPGMCFQYYPESGCIAFFQGISPIVKDDGDDKMMIASPEEIIDPRILANLLTEVTGLMTVQVKGTDEPIFEFQDSGPATELSKKQRQGEIAIACVKYILCKKGFTLNSQIKRELGNVAKELKIDPEELKAFLKPLVQEVLEEALS